MAKEDRLDGIHADVITAVSDAVTRHDPSIVTKCIVLVENVDVDGNRGVWTVASDGMTAWDTLGMLDYAVTLERASVASCQGD